MTRKKWTIEDIEYLKANIGNATFEELAEHFCVSRNSIAHKASKLGISRKSLSGQLWTVEEDNLLRQHFIYAPKNMLVRLFPNRTWVAILQRGLKTLGLTRKSQDKYFINYKALSKWNEFTAYLLGFTMADGYIKRNHGARHENSLQFELAVYDKDILEKIARNLDFEGPITESKRGTAKLYISNTKVLDDLIEKGVPATNKTINAKFPPNIPKDLIRHFIRGLFDGDGSIYIDEQSPVFQLLGTKELLCTIKNILPQFFSSVNVLDRSKSGANIYCLKIKEKKKTFHLLNWMYNDSTIYLQRKYDKYCQIINSPSYGKPCEDRT